MQRGHSVVREARARLLGRSEWVKLIDEWVPSERDRYILTRHLLDGISYDRLNTELKGRGDYPLSDRHLARIISKNFDRIVGHIEDGI